MASLPRGAGGHGAWGWLARIADAFAAIALAGGRLGRWATVPLMLLIIVDVVSRRFFGTGSTMLQELQWHVHALLFLSCLGFAYIRGAHVRIEMVHEHFPPRAKLAIEALGFLLVLAPFCALMIYYGYDIAARAWQQGEGSPNPGGLPHWWIIKSAVPAGLALLLLAGAAVFLRRVIRLFGPAALATVVADREHAETTGASDDRRGR
jgi:TRAP-type mannitol/chloroaromatic compound transport system permease small subunit